MLPSSFGVTKYPFNATAIQLHCHNDILLTPVYDNPYYMHVRGGFNNQLWLRCALLDSFAKLSSRAHQPKE